MCRKLAGFQVIQGRGLLKFIYGTDYKYSTLKIFGVIHTFQFSIIDKGRTTQFAMKMLLQLKVLFGFTNADTYMLVYVGPPKI